MCNLIRFFIFIVLFTIPILNAQSPHLRPGQIPPEISFIAYSNVIPIVVNNDNLNGTVYLLDFWATWCAPCIASIPKMDSLIDAFKGKNVKFISLTYEPKALVKKFLKKHPMKSQIGLDRDFEMFRRYNAWAIPNIVMINANGVIAGRVHPNQLNAGVIEELISGKIPVVKNTPEDLFDPTKAEEYFRSLIDKKE